MRAEETHKSAGGGSNPGPPLASARSRGHLKARIVVVELEVGEPVRQGVEPGLGLGCQDHTTLG